MKTINIPVPQRITKLCIRFKTFEDYIKLINAENVCSAMEHGMLVGSTIAPYIVGRDRFNNVGAAYQKLLVKEVQKFVWEQRLIMRGSNRVVINT